MRVSWLRWRVVAMILVGLLLAACGAERPKTSFEGATENPISVYREESQVPPGSKDLGEIVVHSGRSEDFCIRKLTKRAREMGGNGLLINEVKSTQEKSEDFYPVLGRSIEKEWTETTMRAVALLSPEPAQTAGSENPAAAEQSEEPKQSEPAESSQSQNDVDRAGVQRTEDPSSTSVEPASSGPSPYDRIHDAKASVEKGMWQEAMAELEGLEEMLPNEPEVHRLRALALKGNGQFGPAIPEMQKAIALAPDRGDLPMILGNLQVAVGQFEAAVTSYNACLKVGYKPAQAYYNKAQALGQMGRWVEALAFLNHAAALKPDWPECYWNMAVAAEKLERWIEANDAWRRYLEQSPDSPDRQDVLKRMELNASRR